MIISKQILALFIFCVAVLICFIVILGLKVKRPTPVHKSYYAIAGFMIIWFTTLIIMSFIPPESTTILMRLDCITTICAANSTVWALLLVICYINEYSKKLPAKFLLLFVIPLITAVLVITNPLHHLYYKNFSLINSEVVFGPYFYIHSVYTFSCVFLALILLMRFTLKAKARLQIKQAIYYILGISIPCLMNLLVLFKIIEASVAITPISFMATIVFHGIAIFKLHFFDIKPLAMQQLLNLISDCYLVINLEGLILNFNQPFLNVFGRDYKIRENMYLKECIKDEDIENKTAIYNLMTAVGSFEGTNSRVVYEQSISAVKDNEPVLYYYMVEVTPLLNNDEICGYLAIFKDVTQVKVNMQKVQDSQVKLMERERLAFLGQMVGGLAHNLKTPIMSISGSLSAVEALIRECRLSIGDEEVTEEDFNEIYNDVNDWVQKMRTACAYMSDIINAVKGQARNMNVSDRMDFTLDETLKRVSLLLRHELHKSGCELKIIYTPELEDSMISFHGDINNLVQVLNNLVSNSIDSQKENGCRDILIEIAKTGDMLNIMVKDFGSGVPEHVKKELFKQMVTSKGNMGTGLGIFISNSVIKAKFDGSMWFEDNPEGGSIFGISVPLSNIEFVTSEMGGGTAYEEK